MATDSDHPSFDAHTLQLYAAATLRHRRTLVLSLLYPLGNIIFSVIMPFFATGALARLAQHRPGANLFIGLMAAAVGAGTLLNRLGFTRLMVLQAVVMSDLQELVYTRLLARGTGYHTNQISGKLVSDAIDFVSAYGSLAGAVFINAFPFLLIILTGLIIVIMNSWQLGLYICTVVGITLTWAIIESRTRYALRNRRLTASKNLISHLSDTIVNAQTVKTFARETDEATRDRRLGATLRDLRIHDWQLAGRDGNRRIAVLLVMQVLLMLLVSYLARTDGRVLATGFFAFTYIFTITTRLFEINALIRQIEESLLQASPMTQMLQEPLEVTDAAGAHDLAVKHGAISFTAVHFHYQDTASDQTVFAGLDLDIKPGERIGLVGPSGGGKTTLTRLMLRFEDIDSGRITIDGQDIAAVTQASLRRAISYVPQEPLLFHRSIDENIAYGRPGATAAEIETAADKAHATEFITRLPNGFDTVVGERGVKLSGGQRQRIAIARAILKNAPLLVLDEATSALDSESEVMIQQALWELMQGRTAIVVAHRLSTIQRMDRIIVLDNGAVTEQGSHRQLLSHHGTYASLWHHQSGGFLTES